MKMNFSVGHIFMLEIWYDIKENKKIEPCVEKSAQWDDYLKSC